MGAPSQTLSAATQASNRMNVSQPILWIKRLIWAYFWLLIFEGALRKWVVPSLSNPLLLVRAPIVIAIYALAIQSRVFPWNRWVTACVLLAFAALFAGLYVLSDTPIVPLFGFQADFLHLPLIFIIARVFDWEDVRRVGFWTLVMCLPMSLLMILQFQASPSAWVNAGAGGGTDSQIGGALGHIRPAGLFTFITGPAAFFPLAAAFLLACTFLPMRYPRWLLTTASLALLVGTGVSTSRTLAASVAIVLLCALVVGTVLKPGLVSPRLIARFVGGLALAGIVLFGAAHLPVFQQGLEAFSSRIQSTGDTQDNGQSFAARGVSDFTNLPGLLAEAPLLGHGLGMGTNAGSALITGGEVKYLLAEGESARVILESGPLVGSAYLLLRYVLVIGLAWTGGRIARSGNPLPLLLLSACISLLLSGQFGQPTELGFAVLGGGLSLAAMNPPRAAQAAVVPKVRERAAA